MSRSSSVFCFVFFTYFLLSPSVLVYSESARARRSLLSSLYFACSRAVRSSTTEVITALRLAVRRKVRILASCELCDLLLLGWVGGI